MTTNEGFLRQRAHKEFKALNREMSAESIRDISPTTELEMM